MQCIAAVTATTWEGDTVATKHMWEWEGRWGDAQASLVLIHEMHKAVGHIWTCCPQHPSLGLQLSVAVSCCAGVAFSACWWAVLKGWRQVFLFLGCILAGLVSSVAGHTGGYSSHIHQHAAAHSHTGCHPWGHTRAPLPHRKLFIHSSKRLTTQQTIPSHFSPALVSLYWQPQCRSAKGLWKYSHSRAQTLAVLFLACRKACFELLPVLSSGSSGAPWLVQLSSPRGRAQDCTSLRCGLRSLHSHGLCSVPAHLRLLLRAAEGMNSRAWRKAQNRGQRGCGRDRCQ